jgi:hypothetical protein
VTYRYRHHDRRSKRTGLVPLARNSSRGRRPGFAGFYRSDHFTIASPPDLESLELWFSLTWLAVHSRRIEFGPSVSPVSFRHPVLTASISAAVDDLSAGRLTLGLLQAGRSVNTACSDLTTWIQKRFSIGLMKGWM